MDTKMLARMGLGLAGVAILLLVGCESPSDNYTYGPTARPSPSHMMQANEGFRPDYAVAPRQPDVTAALAKPLRPSHTELPGTVVAAAPTADPAEPVARPREASPTAAAPSPAGGISSYATPGKPSVAAMGAGKGYSLVGQLDAILLANQFHGKVLQVGIDPRYVILVANVRPVGESAPARLDQWAAFAVNSPTQVLGGIKDDLRGRWFKFNVEMQSGKDGVQKAAFLTAEPVQPPG